MHLAKVRTPHGAVVAVVDGPTALLLPSGMSLTDILHSPNPTTQIRSTTGTGNVPVSSLDLLAPIDRQEV
jgi:hypothetical protein